MTIASKGHEHIMSIIKPDMWEYELSSEYFNFCSDFNIQSWAYSPIVGSGKDSSILHYHRNNKIC